LFRSAVLKAQFELIHPFRDGNGRIGRMLVPLIMYTKGLLSKADVLYQFISGTEQGTSTIRRFFRSQPKEIGIIGFHSFYVR